MSRNFSLTRSRMWRTRAATALAAAGALVMSGGVVMLSGAAATAVEEVNENKVVVCKYVKTPNETEVLDHVIIVSVSSLKNDNPGWNETFPALFADAQGGSKAIRYAFDGEQANDVPLSQCDGYTEPSPDPEGKKVVVCKYVGTPPGTPHHIIIVSVNAIKDFPSPAVFPWTFADAQDSVAIRFAAPGEQAKDISLSNCPERRSEKTPAGINISDPCGPNNVTWSAKPDDYFNYSLSNGVVTATLKSPGSYVVTGQTTWTLPADSNVPCATITFIDPPGAPSTTDPCGPANISFNVPADTATLNWTLLGDGNVTVAPQAGYVFSGSSQLLTFTLPADSNVPCIAGVEEIAPAVTFTEPTCENLDGADWSGNLKDIVSYTVSGTPGLGASVTVTATIKASKTDEFAFPAGFDNTFDHTYVTEAALNCPTVKGSESTRPKPDKKPVVLGTQAVAPTAVSAGLAGTPAAPSTNLLLAQLMVGGGLLLLLAGGWLGLGRREHGAHQA